MTKKRKRKPEVLMRSTGEELFIEYDGLRIAKRGHPGTPQARTWISLEPGFAVYDDNSRGDWGALVIEYNGRPVQ